jgi:hypothetical protein
MPIIRFTIKIDGILTDAESCVLSDPTGTYGVRRTDTLEAVVAADTALTRLSAGTYEYSFTDPELDLAYSYYVKYILNGATYYSEGEIAGEASGGFKTLSDIKADVLRILNDSEGEIFEEGKVMLAIESAIRLASRYSPAESKETFTFAQGSRQIDITGLTGFIRLLPEHPAEYPVGYYPPCYRNASVFGKTVTIQVNRNPSEGETVYLYCLKNHSLTDSTSKLPQELEPLIVDYAAGTLALNWVGQGRTQIQSAISDIDSLSHSIQDSENWLSNLTTALAAMVERVSSIEAAAGAGEADLESARDAVTSAMQDFEGKLSEIGGEVELARTDIASGRALVNTISNGLNPENDYFEAAMAELSTLSNILTQARLELGKMQAGEVFSGIATREQAAAGLYSQAAEVYAREATAHLKGAETKLKQAGLQLNAGASRLSVSGMMLSYLRWAKEKIAGAEKNIKALQRPRTYREWGE